MYIVSDIDGTIADTSKRIHYLNEKPKNFKKFYEEAPNDRCIDWTRKILTSVYLGSELGECKLVLCTGRPEKYREQTEYWSLSTARIMRLFRSCRILMRKDNDNRPDHIVKPELLKNAGITPENTFFILEDRSRVVKAYRDLGYNVLQVAEGNY